jgi:hypothetical protein
MRPWASPPPGARSDSVGGLLAELGDRPRDRLDEIVGDLNPFDKIAARVSARINSVVGFRATADQLVIHPWDRQRFRDDPPESVRRYAKAGHTRTPYRELSGTRPASDELDLRRSMS